MSEIILEALMQLFALIANVGKEGISQKAKRIVESYLQSYLNKIIADKYMLLFAAKIAEQKQLCEEDCNADREKRKLHIIKVCKQINEGLRQNEKIVVLLRLLEFVNEDNIIDDKEEEFLEIVNNSFNIPDEELNDLKLFVLKEFEKISAKNKILFIDSNISAEPTDFDEAGSWFDRNRPETNNEFKHLHFDNINGRLNVLHIESCKMFIFRYSGNNDLYLNGHNIIPERAYILSVGAIIKSHKFSPIYYSDVAGAFLHTHKKSKITFSGQNVQFNFKNSKNGIKEFSFQEDSGQLVGIMGGSGVGKSTLLNLLNGKLKPNNGKILINGYDIHEEAHKLEGLIGFVPQDDLLIEELTVFQNLYYNARLCFSQLSESSLISKVNKILHNLDLFEIKDLTVGNPLNKIISGGQRKRLNIALELIRESPILFVDEPTSGLSSMDSEMVMLLLKEQALKGKLVIVNIHQPSSDIYKLFDKLWIVDKGGYIIYNGNPIDAIVYFKTMSNHVNADESECPTCGNVNPEQVLQIVENRIIDDFGKYTSERKISPVEWHTIYNASNEHKEITEIEKKDLPFIFFRIPDIIQQFKIFSARNFWSKITNRQYLLIALLEAPFLALILSYFTKYKFGTPDNSHAYIFAENLNLPAYIFMSVVVSLFIGLSISAEEIIKDRKILERESFLNLSRFSYLNSKIFFLFTLSAIQMFCYVLIGNNILEIKGLTFEYWLVLFSTSCLANMIGLNISSGFNSVVTIYILIPFILVPQLLLSGTIVSFDKLNEHLACEEYVPFVGDFMASRWAYEALSVAQYRDNTFEKRYFEFDMQISNSRFIARLCIPELERRNEQVFKNISANTNEKTTKKYLQLIAAEIERLRIIAEKPPFEYMDRLNIERFDETVFEGVNDYLVFLQIHFREIDSKATELKDSLFNHLTDSLGQKKYNQFKADYMNKSLENIVRNRMEMEKFSIINNKVIQKNDPIFQIPESKVGRAHFFAPYKVLINERVDTFWFNISILWLACVAMYILLQFDVLRKLIIYIENLKLQRKLNS